jgi:2-oxoglutarate ferredoxin oxidoreductase subunit delta
MGKIRIDKEKCKGCLLCIGVCPKGHIVLGHSLNKKGLRHVEYKGGEDCLGCMMCAQVCPDCCIEVYK